MGVAAAVDVSGVYLSDDLTISREIALRRVRGPSEADQRWFWSGQS